MNNTNRITNAIRMIAHSFRPITNRVKAAKLAIKQALGSVPENSVTYRRECPRGAGHCGSHILIDQFKVGSRSFRRRQFRFIKALGSHSFAKNFK